MSMKVNGRPPFLFHLAFLTQLWVSEGAKLYLKTFLLQQVNNLKINQSTLATATTKFTKLAIPQKDLKDFNLKNLN